MTSRLIITSVLLFLFCFTNASHAIKLTAVINDFNLQTREIKLSGKTYYLSPRVKFHTLDGLVGDQLLRKGQTVTFTFDKNNNTNKEEISQITILTPIKNDAIAH